MTRMKLQIAHQIPGRIRMKVPSAKDNPALFEQIRQTFSVILARWFLIRWRLAAVPILGAVGGATVNVIFMDQRIARGISSCAGSSAAMAPLMCGTIMPNSLPARRSLLGEGAARDAT